MFKTKTNLKIPKTNSIQIPIEKLLDPKLDPSSSKSRQLHTKIHDIIKVIIYAYLI